MAERLTLTAYSTALYSTWVFVEELRLLFDAGDGVAAHLLGKGRKAQKVAVSHADRDHTTGLLQLQQLHARHNQLEVLYPRDSRYFSILREVCNVLDPWSGPHVTWTPVTPEQDLSLDDDLKLKVMRNTHVPTDEGIYKSVSYFVIRQVRKLRPELRGLPGSDIARVRAEQDEDATTYVEERGVVAYAGDTGETSPGPWKGCPILIHEATFLHIEDMERGPQRSQEHSVLPDVLAMAREACPDTLVLNHFSSRYEVEQIVAEVRRWAADLRLSFPVHIIPPGIVVEDLLAQSPVWSP